MLRRTVTLSLVFASVVGWSQFAAAQAGKQLIINATVDQVLPTQGIVATDKDGKKYAIGFGPTTKIGLTGTASVDYLSPGAYIQMTVEMDGMGKPIKDVSSIQITERGKFTEPGVFSTKGPEQKAGEPGPFLVRGTVKSIKADELIVTAGAKSVTVKVAAGATIPVTIATWTLAKPGDNISGEGNEVSQPGASMTMVLATRMEIKAVMPITKPGKK